MFISGFLWIFSKVISISTRLDFLLHVQLHLCPSPPPGSMCLFVCACSCTVFSLSVGICLVLARSLCLSVSVTYVFLFFVCIIFAVSRFIRSASLSLMICLSTLPPLPPVSLYLHVLQSLFHVLQSHVFARVSTHFTFNSDQLVKQHGCICVRLCAHA